MFFFFEIFFNMCIRKQNFNYVVEVIKVGFLYLMFCGIVIVFMYSLFNNICKLYIRQLIFILVFILKGYEIEYNYVKIIYKYFLYIVLIKCEIFFIDI